MFDRRYLLAVLALTVALWPVAAADAMEKTPFDLKAFEAAKAAGKPILIEVSAPWCPTCKAQKPTLAKLASNPKFKNMVFYEIDFDTQKDLLRTFNVRSQSTLIAFKGKQEVGRSTGDTNPASIERLLDKAI